MRPSVQGEPRARRRERYMASAVLYGLLVIYLGLVFLRYFYLD
jgi:hypothetical protein